MNELAPIPTGFTSPVASREVTVFRDGGSDTVLLEIGLPVQDVETVAGLDWRCPIRISGGGTQRERHACGVDSLQALRLGLQIVDAEVSAMNGAEGSEVHLFGAPYDGTF